jgi:hypothetical protein
VATRVGEAEKERARHFIQDLVRTKENKTSDRTLHYAISEYPS